MKDRRMNRRRFLTSMGLAAGAVAFPTIVPASALGRGRIPAPSDRITMGFIGMGSMGMNNLRGFIEKDDVHVLAVCDVNRSGDNYAGDGLRGREPARQLVEATYGERTASGSYTGCDAYEFFWQLLERDDIDAVCLALPDHWHAYMTVAAAQAGKDMYSEKPLARTIYEGRAMVNAVRKYDVVFQTGSQQRSDQRFRHACELVRNGYIGDVQKVYAQVGGISKPCPLGEEPIPEGFLYELWLGNAPQAPYHPDRVSGRYNTEENTWRAWRPYSAGHVADWGAHNFDIAIWGLGRDGHGPERLVTAAEAEENELTLHYGGIPVIKKKGPHDGMIQFIGTEGWVGVSRGDIWASDERLLSLEMAPNDVHLYHSDNHHRDFLNCTRIRRRPACDVDVGHSSLTACLLSEIALRLERSLDWDDAKEDFVNDPEASALLTREMRGPWLV
jgi:predicted dehydrogenase